MREWTKEEALEHLDNVYTRTGHELAFASPQRIVQFYNKALSHREARKYVEGQNVYSLHRENRSKPRKNIYNKIFVRSKRELIECDLMSVEKLSEFNRQINFFLICIDSLTGFLFSRPLLSKSAFDVLAAFKILHREMSVRHRVQAICTDLGKAVMPSFLSLSLTQCLTSRRKGVLQ